MPHLWKRQTESSRAAAGSLNTVVGGNAKTNSHQPARPSVISTNDNNNNNKQRDEESFEEEKKKSAGNSIASRVLKKRLRFLLLPLVVLALLQMRISLPADVMNVDPFFHAFTSRNPLKELDIKVFIGIKTSANWVHGSRMAEIQKTWLQDVIARPQVDLKFFAEVNDAALPSNSSQQSWIVPTPKKCGRNRVVLCCKDELMFKYYYENYVQTSSDPFSPWFCSFDDDNYVIIDNLLKVLHSYQQQNDTKIYVGRYWKEVGILWKQVGRKMVKFLTGGAGYCISRQLMEFGRSAMLNLTNHCDATFLPDDMAIGHTVNTVLGVPQRFDEHFHSHLADEQVRDTVPRDAISKQVSFGYNNKLNRTEAAKYFANIPSLYPPEEDPMLFSSLRDFLLKEAATIS